MAYEDLLAGKRAKEVCDAVGRNLGPGWKVEGELASFRLLDTPRLRRIAAMEAAASDIVIVSCHGGTLPDSVRQWVELWLPKCGRPMSLVSLVTNPREPLGMTPEAEEFLSEAAQRGGIEFFSRGDTPDGILRTGMRLVETESSRAEVCA